MEKISVEASALERLLTMSPKGSKDIAPLTLRLADTLVELADALDVERRPAARDMRAKAVAAYQTLISEHPAWCALPRSVPGRRRCIDEVRYALGIQLDLLGRRTEACDTLTTLLDASPPSHFRGLACAYLEAGH